MMSALVAIAVALAVYAVYRSATSRDRVVPAQRPSFQGIAGIGNSAGDYDVVMTNCGPNKILAIKAVREITLMGLGAAKRFVETPNATFPRVNAEAAQHIKTVLEAAGAAVAILNASAPTAVATDTSAELTNVTITDFGPNKIAVINAVRELTNWELVDAIAAAEGHRPLTFLNREAAVLAQSRLALNGAKTELV